MSFNLCIFKTHTSKEISTNLTNELYYLNIPVCTVSNIAFMSQS